MKAKNAQHRAALDQANLLVDYLRTTDSRELSLAFIDEHAHALAEFARQAKVSSDPGERRHHSRAHKH